MKVGDYVRTKNGIEKITLLEWYPTINDYKKYMETDRGEYENLVDFTNILKSSPNIIDLIEVGDYVNGKLVEDIFDKTNYADKSIKLKGSGDYWYNEHIKSIVTKEKFESMEYKIR